MSKFSKFRNSNLSTRLSLKSTRTKIVLIILVVLALLAAGAFFLVNKDSKQNRGKEIVQKIEKLNENENTTCQDVVDSIGGASTSDLEDYEEKRLLLERQMRCFADSDQLDKAIAAAEELKALYTSASDSVNAERVQSSIDDWQATKDMESSNVDE